MIYIIISKLLPKISPKYNKISQFNYSDKRTVGVLEVIICTSILACMCLYKQNIILYKLFSDLFE